MRVFILFLLITISSCSDEIVDPLVITNVYSCETDYFTKEVIVFSDNSCKYAMCTDGDCNTITGTVTNINGGEDSMIITIDGTIEVLLVNVEIE